MEEAGGIMIRLIQVEESSVQIYDSWLLFPKRDGCLLKSSVNIFVNRSTHECQMADQIESNSSNSSNSVGRNIFRNRFANWGDSGKLRNRVIYTFNPRMPPKSPR